MFLVELFIKYIKRLPSLHELKRHEINKLSTYSNIIENEFMNCEEAITCKDYPIPEINETEINNLIFLLSYLKYSLSHN